MKSELLENIESDGWIILIVSCLATIVSFKGICYLFGEKVAYLFIVFSVLLILVLAAIIYIKIRNKG